MMNKRLLLSVFCASLISSAVVFVPAADAVVTRHFLLDSSASLSAGELDGTMVHSRGHVTVGAETTRVELAEAVVAHSIARGENGAVYVGTGNDGKIYRVAGEEVSLFAETGQLLVRSLLMVEGTLYAGTLPEGRIFKIDASGSVDELARPENAEHIWDLAWHEGRLLAATGPEGKVFSISSNGRAELMYDSEAAHVMSLAVDGDAVYAGTSDDALLLRLKGAGNADVVYDFPGNEVTAIDARDGVVVATANEFTAPRASGSKLLAKLSKGTSRPRDGKGRLWRVEGERAERIFSRDAGHFTDVQLSEDGVAFVAGGKQGRIFRVNADRSHAMYLDVDERQVLAIDLVGERPVFVTGDGAALYRVRSGAPQNASWQSKVLDASFHARFGQLTWRGDGPLSFSTRSGNTEEPDETWTEWSNAMTSPGPVRSQAARFVQVRAMFGNADATLRAVQLYYLPQNQRTTIRSVGLKRTKAASKKKGASARRDRPSTTYPLTWAITNPDRDSMRYRLRFRNENQNVWRDILRDDERLTATNYTWQTSGLPDGYYVVQVEGSDELQNPEELTLTSTMESEPLLIDNHPPRIDGLAFRGGKVRGRAIDGLGPISKLEYAVDGGEWRLFFPSDHLLDTANEAFELTLPELPAGEHIVAVRATDAGHNTVSAEVTTR